jgi:glycosyltransferase 2 family protein
MTVTPPPSPKPRASLGFIAVRVLFVGVAAFALWNTLRQAELGRAAALAGAVGAPIALVLVPYIAVIACHAEAYRRVLGVLGHRVSFPRIYSVVLSTEAVLMSFPAGIAVSDSLNPYLLRRRCDIPIPDGLAGIAAKKSLIVFSNALYVTLAVAFGFGYLRLASERLLGFRGLEWIVAASAVGLYVMVFAMAKALVSGSLAARSHGLLERIPSAKLRAFLADKKSGFLATDRHFDVLFRERRTELAASAALLLAMWLLESVETLVILRLLHVSLGFTEVLALEVVVVMLRSLAFVVPGALGVLDAGYVAFLGAFGVLDAPTVGVAFMLIKRAKELVWIAVGFLLFLVMKDAPPRAEAAGAPLYTEGSDR